MGFRWSPFKSMMSSARQGNVSTLYNLEGVEVAAGRSSSISNAWCLQRGREIHQQPPFFIMHCPFKFGIFFFVWNVMVHPSKAIRLVIKEWECPVLMGRTRWKCFLDIAISWVGKWALIRKRFSDLPLKKFSPGNLVCKVESQMRNTYLNGSLAFAWFFQVQRKKQTSWHLVALCLRTKIPFFWFSPDRLGVKILNKAESYSHQGGTKDTGRH